MSTRRTITQAELRRLLKAARSEGFDDVRLTPSGEIRFLMTGTDAVETSTAIRSEIEEWARDS